MKAKFIISGIAFFLFFGCKDETIEIRDYSGFYDVVFETEQRFQISDEKADENQIEFMGKHIDTTAYFCCPWGDSSKQYSGYNFEIFEHNDQFYLRNKLNFDDQGNRTTFDIPLIERNDSLIFDYRTAGLTSNYFYGQLSKSQSMDLLSIAINVTEKDFGKGSFVFINHTSIVSRFTKYTCQNLETTKVSFTSK